MNKPESLYALLIPRTSQIKKLTNTFATYKLSYLRLSILFLIPYKLVRKISLR